MPPEHAQLTHFAITATAFTINTATPKPEGIARIYDATLMCAGAPKGWHISPDVLDASVNLWPGASVYTDHPGVFDGAPSVNHLVGVIRSPFYDSASSSVKAQIHILALSQAQNTIELLDTLIAIRATGEPAPPIGLSAVLDLDWEYDERDRRIVKAIEKVWSVDVVFEPAAGGNVTRIVNSVETHAKRLASQPRSTSNIMPPEITNPTTPATVQPAMVTTAASAAPPAVTNDLANAVMLAQCEQLLSMRLAASNFPPTVQASIRARFDHQVFNPADLDTAIEQVRTVAAAFNAGETVQGMGTPAHRARVSGMFDSRDQVEAAYDLLMGLPVRPELRNVARLSGIRELYIGLTGDRDMRGMYQPQYAQFAVSVATSPNTAAVMAELTANVQNKLLLAQWNRLAGLGYTWWRRAALIGQFNSLQPTKWIVAGGFGDLPTVAEGAAYTELTWNDKSEAVNFVKKGGYTSLTLEMIDRDDVMGWKSVGTNLATAALRTISGSVATIFTTPPTMGEDSVAMFHATHGNLGAAALDATTWDAAVQAMYKQTEVNSAKRLGLRPDRVLVPIELRKAALALFFSTNEPGGQDNDINVARVSGDKDSEGPVIVVPEFTDASDWVALAPPDLAPVVGVGFRFGEQPEIMSVADPNSFLMFFQDALPIKVRWFYAVGAVDYRGAYKAVVA